MTLFTYFPWWVALLLKVIYYNYSFLPQKVIYYNYMLLYSESNILQLQVIVKSNILQLRYKLQKKVIYYN